MGFQPSGIQGCISDYLSLTVPESGVASDDCPLRKPARFGRLLTSAANLAIDVGHARSITEPKTRRAISRGIGRGAGLDH
jgi:hypothetical protein